MKKILLHTVWALAACILCTGCEEDEYSKEYDIELPAVTISAISNDKPFVDDEITLTGTHMNTVTSASIGSYNFNIVSVDPSGTTMTLKVPRTIESGKLTLMNKYKRELVTTQSISPQFYPAKVTTWPSQIERGRPFTLKGENMDLIKEVKLNGVMVAVNGSATPGSAAYVTAGVEMDIDQEVVIEVSPKVGEKQTSAPIKVVKPKETYVPKRTWMILDFDATYTPTNGDAKAPFKIDPVNGMFGKAVRVTADAGNGWDGIYARIENNNGGQGYDLSAYNKPHITMLINTNGGQGYVQPILTDAVNGIQDRHLTGGYGYGDDYKCKTNGWEWRSYDLEKMGFPVVKGQLDKIGVQFRGGNINGTPFTITVDQVMITDGPLNPTVVWDCETKQGDFFTLKNSGQGGLDGYNQGDKYASYIGPVTGGWKFLGEAILPVNGLDNLVYANGIWANMMINTGNNNGYTQFEFAQDSKQYWLHFIKSMGYGDDYKFAPTQNKWQWRSMRIDPEVIGQDLSKAFTLKLGATTGNISSGTFELNLDYVVFTTVPLDPNLDTDEL